MVIKNYKMKPKNFEGHLLEFINLNPNGVSSRMVSKKFNLEPSYSGKILNIFARKGLILRVPVINWCSGPKAIYYPVFICQNGGENY